MRLGVVAEAEAEARVAIVPNSVPKLSKLGFEVVVESGAGDTAHHSDSEYEGKGAAICDRRTAMSADIVIAIGMPDVSQMKAGQMLACITDPFRCPENI